MSDKKIDDRTVRYIKWWHGLGKVSQAHIAKHFKINAGTVSAILSGKIYKDVTGKP